MLQKDTSRLRELSCHAAVHQIRSVRVGPVLTTCRSHSEVDKAAAPEIRVALRRGEDVNMLVCVSPLMWGDCVVTDGEKDRSRLSKAAQPPCLSESKSR